MTEDPGPAEPHRIEPAQLRASDADRERVAQQLHTAMGDGRITMAELEQRLGIVYAAKTLGELEPVLADLPGAVSPVTSSPQPPAPVSPRAPESRIGGTPGSATSIAIMSGTDRKGSWVVPRQHNSFAFWGGVEIDLREARFAEREVTITAVAIMAGIDVIVPDDVHVRVTGIGVMGAFEQVEKKDPRPEDEVPEGAPVVTVNGLAFWAGVEVRRMPRRKKVEGGGDRRLE
ncbi:MULTISPECIES: DUF1707 SHOCT-like domain-containing protein [Prauserella salsuginis group]|uniref:Cell wall-active antibiotic response 4TMS protein YvqF n=2 Tax=Prauserella salsuginis group TaxID=2893672 RepID=A0A839XFE6_9PSEU|nr:MULTISPECIES: DUF1707 domain-containing protein [Prauserella salsuginis group]MBB3661980.1 hypothetical protein [Prauserella sediminis]MCR3719679.1 Cell wall-active antibiotics response 4TMS YvqF [Prauserella flava]MCR3736778.1 Cell wall-active antibiotics response 4TMS YvqF [Prauserella salsuginis]